MMMSTFIFSKTPSNGRQRQQEVFFKVEFVGLLKGLLHGHGCFRDSLSQQVVLRLLRQHIVFVFQYSTSYKVEYAAVLFYNGYSRGYAEFQHRRPRDLE